MTRRKSVFMYNILDDSVTMNMMNNHLMSNGIKGAKLWKIICTSYKVDIDAKYYDKICDSSLWRADVHDRIFF